VNIELGNKDGEAFVLDFVEKVQGLSLSEIAKVVLQYGDGKYDEGREIGYETGYGGGYDSGYDSGYDNGQDSMGDCL